MKSLLLSICTVALVGFIFSCKKSDNNTTTNNNASFTWTENGGATITADSAKWTTGTWGTGIRAWKASGTYYFEINWDNQNNTGVGTKALTAPYGFTMLKNSSSFSNNATSSLNVTAFANDKLSGNFTVPVSDGASTMTINGTFTNIPKM